VEDGQEQQRAEQEEKDEDLLQVTVRDHAVPESEEGVVFGLVPAHLHTLLLLPFLELDTALRDGDVLHQSVGQKRLFVLFLLFDLLGGSFALEVLHPGEGHVEACLGQRVVVVDQLFRHVDLEKELERGLPGRLSEALERIFPLLSYSR